MRCRASALCLCAPLAWAQQAAATDATKRVPDPVATLVGRLNLESYKATIKGLTQFGDRLQGTDRNRAAVDWIEARLKSYGCTNTERIRYDSSRPVWAAIERSINQPDARLRELNSQPSTPGPREEVYCTKVGVTHPEEMYIVGAHMDGAGGGEAANDDGSGVALVMELARVLSGPEVQTDRSIRLILWNSEEFNLQGAQAYVAQRKYLQGLESPAGSGRYPEPTWLGMIQHDMLLFDHGRPRKDGTISKDQRAEADINIEYRVGSRFVESAKLLARKFQMANQKYAPDYPANIGAHMSSTDSALFEDLVAAISVRENERLSQIGNGWDPHWHQPTDLYATFTDDDFRLGLNAAKMTLGAVAQLTGAKTVTLASRP